ncbi:hypothetical protein ACJ8PF_23325, partial [Serratia sp. CY81166]
RIADVDVVDVRPRMIGSMLFIWAIAFILQNVDPSDENTFDDERASGPSIRHGNDGYGYYSSSDDLTSERLD